MTSLIKIGVISLGCPKNLADLEGVLAELPDFLLVSVEEADFVFLNTCAFLKTARDEVFETLQTLQKKNVILLGCITGTLDESIFDDYPQIQAIISSANYSQIFDVLQEVINGNRVFAVSEEPKVFEQINNKVLLTSGSYAYVKISEGCDKKCSYCLIPKLKGKYRSRKMKEIVYEVEGLVEAGVREIILVAQDSGDYGIDIYKKRKLADLLKKIVKIKGDFWVRVMYIYPENISSDLLKVMSESEKICNYLDIPLQHGDEKILRGMNRVSDLDKIYKKIDLIKECIPNIAFRTSLIVGFPCESEKCFNNLMKFLKKINFDHVGAFEYSREEGTKAYEMNGQIDEDIKKKRKEKLMLSQQKISFKKMQEHVGKKYKTLIEFQDLKNGFYVGRSYMFAPEIDGVIFVKSDEELKLNEFYDVEIVEAREYDLVGMATRHE